jgi:uncharacterized protein (TIRG00374 family)
VPFATAMLECFAVKKWQLWVGIFISILFIWLALRGLQLERFWDTLRVANYWWLAPGLALYFLAVWVRAWRWHYLLRPIKSIPANSMFPITVIGYMGNNIYPARAGEILRAVILKRRESVPVSASLATIIVERIFDGVVMLAFVFANLPELARLTHSSGFVGNIEQVALVGTGVFVAALIAFLLAAMFPATSIRLGSWLIERWVPGRMRETAGGLMHRFLDGLAALRSPFSILMVFLGSVVIWLLETGKYWFVMHAFPFEVDFYVLMLMNGIVNLFTTLPAAPGYIGTFDAPGIEILQNFGVPGSIATAYTAVLHAALWFPITALGAWYLWQEHLSWEEAEAEVESEMTAEEPQLA